MKNKYLIYKEEIADLFDMGNSYAQIAQILIERHGLDVTKDHLRKSIKEIVKYLIDEGFCDTWLNSKTGIRVNIYRQGSSRENTDFNANL